MYERHEWIETSKTKRYCSKCGLEQTKDRSFGGSILVTIRNPKWKPKQSMGCEGKNERTSTL